MSSVADAPKSTADSVEATAVAMEFDVFISYSRKNSDIARVLERALDAYVPPEGLGLPRTQLRVFRDESDIRGSDYVASIRNHLSNSRKLLVVCSPAARASVYVNEEIEIFAQVRGPEHIISILWEGLPNNETAPETASLSAFPDALMRAIAMPLAIDYRGRDIKGKRVASGENAPLWFSLLSNCYDISRDSIEQRELRRRRRSIRNWTVFLSLVGVSLASLTVWALISRAEATRQAAISRASELSAAARSINGMQLESAQRRALVAAEAVARNAKLGVDRPDAVQIMADAMGRLPRLALSFAPRVSQAPVAFSGDGQAVFVPRDNSVERWRLNTASIDGRIDLPNAPTSLVAGSTSDMLAIIDANAELRIVNSWKTDATMPTEAIANVACAAINQAHTRLAVVIGPASTGQEIQVRSLPDFTVQHRLKVPDGVSVSADEDYGLPCQEFSPGTREPEILLTRVRAADEDQAWGALALRLPGGAKPFVLSDEESSAPVGGLIELPKAAGHRNVKHPRYVRQWRDGARLQFIANVYPRDSQIRLLRFDDALIRTSVDDWTDHPGKVSAVVKVSPDATRYVTVRSIGEDPYVHSLYSNELEIRETADGLSRAEVPGGGANTWQFARDSRSLIAVHGSLVRYFSVNDSEEIYRINARSAPVRVIEAPGSRFVALQSADRAVDIWDVAHPQELARLPDVALAELSADARRIAAARGGHVQVIALDGSAGALALEFPGRPTTLRWSADAQFLAVISSPDPLTLFFEPDQRVLTHIYDVDHGGRLQWSEAGALEAAFHPFGGSVAVLDKEGAVTLRELEHGRSIWSQNLRSAARAQFSPKGDVVAVTVDSLDVNTPLEREIVFLDVKTGKRVGSVSGDFKTSVFSPDGEAIVVLPESGAAFVQHIRKNTRQSLSLPPSTDTLVAAAFADSQRLAGIASAQGGTFLGARFSIQEAAFTLDLATGTAKQQLPILENDRVDEGEPFAQEDVPYLASMKVSERAAYVGGTVYASFRAYWQLAAERVRKDAVLWDVRQDPREVFRQPNAEVLAINDTGGVVLTTVPGVLTAWSIKPSTDPSRVCAHLRRVPDEARWKTYLDGEPPSIQCD